MAYKVGALKVLTVRLPEGMPPHWDLADPVPDGVDVERLLADAEPAALDEEELDAEGEKGGRKQSLSSGDRLFRWASDQTDLYCDGDDAYADVWMDGHRETLPVHSRGSRAVAQKALSGANGERSNPGGSELTRRRTWTPWLSMPANGGCTCVQPLSGTDSTST